MVEAWGINWNWVLLGGMIYSNLAVIYGLPTLINPWWQSVVLGLGWFGLWMFNFNASPLAHEKHLIINSVVEEDEDDDSEEESEDDGCETCGEEFDEDGDCDCDNDDDETEDEQIQQEKEKLKQPKPTIYVPTEYTPQESTRDDNNLDMEA